MLALLLALAAFGCLGLATNEHGSRMLGRRPQLSTKRRLRLAACLSLAMSFTFAVAGRGWVFGPIVWAGLLMVGAAGSFLALNFGPKRR